MREILFRGKNEHGEWLYGSVLHQTDYYGNEINKYYIIDGTDTVDEIGPAEEVFPKTVGQYIEIEDKSGKKIFEGDIIKCDYDDVIYDDYSLDHFNIGRRVIETTKICVCEIDKLNPCFVLRNIKNEFDVEYDFIKCDLLELEVIGNIHDNPELLKEETK